MWPHAGSAALREGACLTWTWPLGPTVSRLRSAPGRASRRGPCTVAPDLRYLAPRRMQVPTPFSGISCTTYVQAQVYALPTAQARQTRRC